MGYTRYWTRTDKPINEIMISFTKELIKDCEKKGIKICDGLGEGEPIITEEHILINGDSRKNLDHETFLIDNNPGGNFCKTARKPYDYAVKTLLDEAESLGLVKNVSCDGGCFFKTDKDFDKYQW